MYVDGQMYHKCQKPLRAPARFVYLPEEPKEEEEEEEEDLDCGQSARQHGHELLRLCL